MEPEDRAAIAGIEVQEFHDETGRIVLRVHKIRLERKQPALETIGQMHGLIGYQPRSSVASAFAINIFLDDPETPANAEQPAIDVTPPPKDPNRDLN